LKRKKGKKKKAENEKKRIKKIKNKKILKKRKKKLKEKRVIYLDKIFGLPAMHHAQFTAGTIHRGPIYREKKNPLENS
jgi:hypothetical protein